MGDHIIISYYVLPVLWFKDPLRLICKIVCFNILILKASLNLPYEKVCTVYENQFNFMTVNWPIVYMMCIYSNPMDYSPPGSSVQGIFQARILKWVAISSSRGSSQSRDQNRIS